MADEGVIHGGHDEVGDATAGITPSACESIGSADDVLIKEASRPYLARHEGAAEDANKEAACVETTGGLDEGCEADRNGA